jgi:hypothetical protein
VQRPVTLGLAVSLLGVLTCAGIAILAPRRRTPLTVAPRLGLGPPRSQGATATTSILRAGAVAAVVGFALVDVRWVLAAGGVTALALAVRRWRPRGPLARRPFEWVAVGLAVAVAVAVAVIERRDAPIPDAGWTLAVDHLHGMAVFAAVLLAAGAVTADDAAAP